MALQEKYCVKEGIITFTIDIKLSYVPCCCSILKLYHFTCEMDYIYKL